MDREQQNEDGLVMVELMKLEKALSSLNKNVTNFPIRAVSLDDFETIEEKIKNTRESLKPLNAQLIILHAKRTMPLTLDVPDVRDIGEMLDELHEAMTNCSINDRTIKLCLYSKAIDYVLFKSSESMASQEKMKACMQKIFSLNDAIISLQQLTEEALIKQVDLKVQCQRALLEYRDFFNKQRELMEKRLQKVNPEITKNKKKVHKILNKINVTKKLITNMIAAGSRLLTEEPVLLKMLSDHRNSIRIETILDMARKESSEGS